MSEAAGSPCTFPDILAALNVACRGYGNQSALAEKAGVTPQYINRVINGLSPPGPSLMHALGFRKIVTVSYERISA